MLFKAQHSKVHSNSWRDHLSGPVQGQQQEWTEQDFCHLEGRFKNEIGLLKLPYSRHYKPRLVYFFTPFPKTIYVLWPLALCMSCIQERLLIKSGLWWRAYGKWIPFLLLCYLILFVFWKKLKTPKRHFEINWPLVLVQQITKMAKLFSFADLFRLNWILNIRSILKLCNWSFYGRIVQKYWILLALQSH